MNPLSWLKERFGKQHVQYKLHTDSKAELPPPIEPPPILTGGVVRGNKRMEFSPDARRGAPVVRAMPRELKKVKESQEIVRGMAGE